MAHWKHAAAILAASAIAGAALAQTPTAPRDPNMPDPKTVPAEKMAPADPATTGGTGGSLSEKLERSEGVIRPRATGDAMSVPAPVPNPGTTRVIPPPGTSPSDPVQPK